MVELGDLKQVAIRQLWPYEARDFTPWLVENIDRLSEAIGLDLEVSAREAGVGDFSLDILAKDLGTGRSVIIENQFGATDHDHLGKLITYAAGTDATAIIWITESIRDEHRQAIEWLNRRTDGDLHFFAVVLEAVQIDESRPAIMFKPVVYPNEWQRTTREKVEHQASPRGESYRAFFQGLIDELREKYHFTGAKAGQPQNWYTFKSGIQGIGYGTSFARGGRVRVEVYIDQSDGDLNKALFDGLFEERSDIERLVGESIEWERLDAARACRIAIYREGSIEMPESALLDIRSWAIQRLLTLKQVIGPRVLAALNRNDEGSAARMP